MFYVKNESEEQKIWGGIIFEINEKKYINLSDRSAFQQDINFYHDALESLAIIFNNDDTELEPIDGCAYVKGDVKVDEEGITLTRMKQVPESFSHRSRMISFTTATNNSLNQQIWLNQESTDCQLKFYKLVDNVITSTTYDESTITSIRWTPSIPTMVKRVKIQLENTSNTIKSFIGIHGGESLPIGWQYMNSLFKLNNVWEIERLEPRLIPGPLNLYMQHALSEQVYVEILVEYFANYE